MNVKYYKFSGTKKFYKKTILAVQEGLIYEKVLFITHFVISMNVKYYTFSGIGK